jgi:hypothetical protein
MELFYRPITMIVELIILMALISSLFAGALFALFDLGFNKKYQKFVTWVMMIVGLLVLVFFTAHLITFYPRISPLPHF